MPTQVALVPLLQVLRGIGINGTFPAVWLAHIGFGMPLAVYIIRNYMATLPKEVIESAKIDGASHFQTFWRLILPMSTPVLASFAIFQFLWVWNDLLNALVFIGPATTSRSPSRWSGCSGNQGQGWQLLTAGGLFTMIVPIIVFLSPAAVLRPWADRRLGQGLTAASAVRGRPPATVAAPIRSTVDPRGPGSTSTAGSRGARRVAYRLDERPFRPVSEARRVGNYRPEPDGAGRRVLG